MTACSPGLYWIKQERRLTNRTSDVRRFAQRIFKQFKRDVVLYQLIHHATSIRQDEKHILVSTAKFVAQVLQISKARKLVAAGNLAPTDVDAAVVLIKARGLAIQAHAGGFGIGGTQRAGEQK